MEKRVIDVDALGIGKAKREVFNNPAYADGWNSVIDIIENAPTVDAVEVVHGRWEKSVVIQTDISELCDYTCSNCSIVTTRESNYCPNCGAKMDGERRND